MSHAPDEVGDATLRLLLAPGLGPATLRKLREHFGSDEAACRADARALTAIRGIGRTTAGALRAAIAAADPDRERRAMTGLRVRLVLRGDDDFPPLLAPLPDAPEALWIRGTAAPPRGPAVAIVGARRASPYGREQAARFAALLAEVGLAIVSGGAAGVDAAAHRGALRVSGMTVAVMGCGLATSYPPRHARLFEEIVDAGGLLMSEHPMDARPLGAHFPRRNRVISGLSLGVLVIEAAARSGALITARLAAEEHGREVMCLPGRVDSPASAGCLRLVRDGGAALVTNHVDVLRQLDLASGETRRTLAAAGGDVAAPASLLDAALTDGQRAVMKALTAAGGRATLDRIAAETDRPVGELLVDVTRLEIHGRVRRAGGGVIVNADAW